MNSLSLKKMLVGTWAGDVLESLRDRLELYKTSGRHFEEAGKFANDHLFRHLMVRLPKPDKTFLDVGGHIGSVTAAVLRNAPGARVAIVEAIPEKAAYLRKRFPSATIHECALGNQSGTVTFYVSRIQSGYSSLSNESASQVGQTEAITVAAKRLDDLAFDLPVDAMKIDVEGAEQGVIEGGKALLRRDRPLIFFESGSPHELPAMGFTKAGIWNLLDSLDYAILIPTRVAHADTGMSCEGFIESHLYPRRTDNYIAIPRERRDEVRQRVKQLLGFRD